MRKRFLAYSVLGLAAFLVFMLIQAPAALVTDHLGQRMAGFGVQAVQGTALSGAAQGVRWRAFQVENLVWRWRPLALFTGRLEFDLNIRDPETTLQGKVALEMDRDLRFRALSGRLPLAKLGALARQPALPMQGVVDFDLQELHLNAAGQPRSAHGLIRLLNLRTDLGQALDLGDFELQLRDASPNSIQGTLKDAGGPLVLEGVLTVDPDGRYRLNGQAAVRDAGNQALRKTLQLLGPPNNNGQWPLNFSGVLAL